MKYCLRVCDWDKAVETMTVDLPYIAAARKLASRFASEWLASSPARFRNDAHIHAELRDPGNAFVLSLAVTSHTVPMSHRPKPVRRMPCPGRLAV